jgi:ubiquinone/menaquinone biosynthesis C-methylase UbiE
MQADELQFADGSVDLVTLVRVLHHLPDPEAELSEIARVLSPDGCAIIEVANYAHMRNRLKYLIRGKRMPVRPVDIRSAEHRGKDEVPFVNHNPKTLMRQLEHAGLRVERTLSVSNLRSSTLKERMPLNAMLAAENFLQAPLSYLLFGPSIFFLVRKNTK